MDILSREGLIVRAPRRGTFIRRAAPRPRPSARGLVVAINVCDPPGRRQFVPLEMLGATEFLAEHGAHVAVKAGPRRAVDMPAFCRQLLADGVAGLLWHSPGDEATRALARAALDTGLPVVLLNTRVEDMPVDYVTCHNVAGGALAADYLLGLGHRRVAFAASSDDVSARDRWEGFRGRVSAAGAWGIGFLPDPAASADPLTRLLDGRSAWTAALCGHDALAAQAIRGLLDRGARVPDDVSILGYDDSADLCEHAPVPITSVAQPAREMGSRAAQFLWERLTGHEPPAPRRVLLTPWLTVRCSAAAPPKGR
jgi:DNA-binding LacI/PurR family transcriptional regulator